MVRIYVEGGGGKEGKARCREGFEKLVKKCGFKGRMPRIVACGPRGEAYRRFNRSLSDANEDIFLLVDSEDPVKDISRTWEHLMWRDKWDKPGNATDDDVLFMTTCMETWLVADRDALRDHFGNTLQNSALPPLQSLESRDRKDVQARLIRATRQCKAPYKKGPKSYEILGKLDPEEIEKYLPSFKRMRSILDDSLA